MPLDHDTDWTDEQIEALCDLWNRGEPAGYIARVTDKTLGDVLIKAHRLELRYRVFIDERKARVHFA